MLVAGGLLWANVSSTEDFDFESLSSFVPDFVTGSFETESRSKWHNWGWPYTMCRQRLWTTVTTSKKVPKEVEPKPFVGPGPIEWDWKLLFLNTVAAPIVLGLVQFILEWRIRRREARTS